MTSVSEAPPRGSCRCPARVLSPVAPRTCSLTLRCVRGPHRRHPRGAAPPAQARLYLLMSPTTTPRTSTSAAGTTMSSMAGFEGLSLTAAPSW
jgi:hypothetical protein